MLPARAEPTPREFSAVQDQNPKPKHPQTILAPGKSCMRVATSICFQTSKTSLLQS